MAMDLLFAPVYNMLLEKFKCLDFSNGKMVFKTRLAGPLRRNFVTNNSRELNPSQSQLILACLLRIVYSGVVLPKLPLVRCEQDWELEVRRKAWENSHSMANTFRVFIWSLQTGILPGQAWLAQYTNN